MNLSRPYLLREIGFGAGRMLIEAIPLRFIPIPDHRPDPKRAGAPVSSFAIGDTGGNSQVRP